MSSFTQSQTVNGREEIAFACSDFSLQVFQSPGCFSSSQVFFVFCFLAVLIANPESGNQCTGTKQGPSPSERAFILCGHCSHGNLPKETKYEHVTNGQRLRAHWEKLYVTRKQ